MKTTAITPALGVEVSGDVDLENPEVVGRLTEALKWRGVLLFRGLNLDDDGQLEFSRKLGRLVQPAPGQEIFTVSLDPAKSPSAEYLKGTFSWHIDDTTNDVPAKPPCSPAATSRRSAAAPSSPTPTPPSRTSPRPSASATRDCASSTASKPPSAPSTPTPTDEQVARWRQLPTHESSLVWDRRDGRRSLVIGATADHIVGMEPDESRALIDELQAWATQERFCYAHDWEVGDMVVWDNTGMLHRALPYDPSSERLMRRVTIVGDEAWQ